MDIQTSNDIHNDVRNFINSYGSDVYINYYTLSTCLGHTGGVDSSYKEAMNPNCSTCDGTGYVKTYQPVIRKAIMNSFLGNKGFIDNKHTIIGIVPYDNCRLTFYLPDVLLSINSSVGMTYLDSCESVSFHSYKYEVKNTNRTEFIIETFLSRVHI